MFLNRRCERVRATEHAPHGPSRVLERIHGLAEIVKRGLVVVVELSPVARRRSVDSSSLRRDGRRRDGCARSDGVRDTVLILIEVLVPVCRPRLCTLLRGLVCVVRSFRSRARRGCNPQNPLPVLPCFLGNETALCPRARQRFVADGCCARVLVVSDLSSTSKLVELAFCYDRVMCLSNEPI